MKTTFITTLIASLATAKLHWSELGNYTFQQYVHDYNLDIKHGTEDYSTRFAIFTKELERVIAHNLSGASWKENINHMSHLTAAEKNSSLGYVKGMPVKFESQKDLPDHVKLLPVSELPSQVDWRTQGVVSAVKD